MKWQRKPEVVDTFQFEDDPVELQQWVSSVTGKDIEHKAVPMQYWPGEPAVIQDGKTLKATMPGYVIVFGMTGEQRVNLHDFITYDGDHFEVHEPSLFFEEYEPLDDAPEVTLDVSSAALPPIQGSGDAARLAAGGGSPL